MKIKILTYIYNILLSIISSIQLIISPENEYNEIEEDNKTEYSIKSINKIDVEEITKNIIRQHYKDINIDSYIFKDCHVDRCYISYIGDIKAIDSVNDRMLTKFIYTISSILSPYYKDYELINIVIGIYINEENSIIFYKCYNLRFVDKYNFTQEVYNIEGDD